MLLCFFSLPINLESADNSCALPLDWGLSTSFADEFERPQCKVTTPGIGCQTEEQGMCRRERRKIGMKVCQAVLVGEKLGVFRFTEVVQSNSVDWSKDSWSKDSFISTPKSKKFQLHVYPTCLFR